MNIKKQNQDPAKTILVIIVGLVILYLITKWQWTIKAAVIVGIISIFSSYLAKKIDFIWMKLAWLLSLIVPNILLSVVFYLFLTPLGILSRILGEKNQLNLKNTADSLFKDHKQDFEKTDFEKTW